MLASFLSVPPALASQNGAYRRVANPDCLNGAGADSVLLRFDIAMLRGELFRGLYLDLRRSPPRAPVKRGDIEAAWRSESDGNFVATQRFADCVVEADTKAADEFVTARIASAQQDDAVRRVAGAMHGCLQQGLTLQMSRIVLEGIISEALYRRATALEGTLAATGKN